MPKWLASWRSYPFARNVIIHVGTNDISEQASEILNQDSKLPVSLVSSDKHVFTSGPIPPFGRGIDHFSRTLSFLTWPLTVSTVHNMFFIYNFNLFWSRPSFYFWDGIHLVHLGVRILSSNKFYSVEILLGM